MATNPWNAPPHHPFPIPVFVPERRRNRSHCALNQRLDINNRATLVPPCDQPRRSSPSAIDVEESPAAPAGAHGEPHAPPAPWASRHVSRARAIAEGLDVRPRAQEANAQPRPRLTLGAARSPVRPIHRRTLERIVRHRQVASAAASPALASASVNGTLDVGACKLAESGRTRACTLSCRREEGAVACRRRAPAAGRRHGSRASPCQGL